MRTLTGILVSLIFLNITANAVREIVVIEQPQMAQRVEGVVLDPTGSPIEGMTVTDRTGDWKSVIRETTTDSKGCFHFSTQRGKDEYHLQFDHPSWNPLRLVLQLDKKARQKGIVAKPEIGG